MRARHAVVDDAIAEEVLSGVGDAPWPAYSWFRENRPVYRSGVDGTFYVFRAQDQRALLADPRVGVEHPFRISRQVLGTTLLDIDGPKHRWLRRHFGPLFNGANLRRLLEQVICVRVEQLVEELSDRAETEMVRDIAQRLPPRIICDFLGIDESRIGWVETRLDLLMHHLETSGADFDVVERFRTEIQEEVERARHVFALRERTVNEDRFRTIQGLSDEIADADRMALSILALAAGVETSVCTIANTLYCLLSHPAELASCSRDPEHVVRFVRESIRWLPAQHDTVRFAREALEVAGVAIPRGAAIRLMLASGNRDSRAYERSEVFEPNRPEGASLSFGHGTHACLGRAFATTTVVTLLGCLVARLERAELVGSPKSVPFEGRTFRRPSSLRASVSWRAGTRAEAAASTAG